MRRYFQDWLARVRLSRDSRASGVRRPFGGKFQFCFAYMQYLSLLCALRCCGSCVLVAL